MDRRKFIRAGALAGAGLATMPFDAEALDVFGADAQKGYELLILATNWGYTGTWEEFCARIRKDGYDGAEIWFPSKAEDLKKISGLFSEHGLRLGFLIAGQSADPRRNLEEFETALKGAVAAKPLYVNCHSGKDFFTFSQNKPFIDLTKRISADTGVPVYHETHRGRILYSAPVTSMYMEQMKELRLTLDISHWCNVHESLLDDQKETVAAALDRTDHVHARIGHAEGPQVNDPRAPEWQKAVSSHLAWWDSVVKSKRDAGKRITFLTEFGPADYLPALPYTRQPVANQWDVNVYMLQTLRKRYS